MATIKIDDTEFYYEIHGKGKTIVLINGFGTHVLAWYPMLDILKKDNQILIFDNRGAGRTKYKDVSWTIEDMAEDTVKLIQKLDIKKPSIFGHSMGGSIAQRIAINYPQLIDKIVLSSCSAKFNFAFCLAVDFILYLTTTKIPIEKQLQNIFPWMYSADFLEDEENYNERIDAFFNNPYPASEIGYKRQFEALKAFDSRKDLKKIKAKTLILRGEKDIVCLLDETKFLKEKIEDSCIQFMKNTGHDTYVECPDNSAKIIVDFVNEK